MNVKRTIRGVVNTVQSSYLNLSLLPQRSCSYIHLKIFSSNSVMLDTTANLRFVINGKHELHIKL